MIFGSDLGGALYLWMSVCLRVWKNSSILTLELNNSAPDHLIELKFGTLNHLRMYIMMLMSEQLSTAVISCQQLFFTSRSPKVDDRGLLCKSLFSKMFWKLSVDEFWVLKLFCSSKTDRVTDFFLFQLSKHFSCFFLLGSIMCPSVGTLVSFDNS